jgi:glycosidase
LNVSDLRGASGDQRIIRYTSNHDVNGSDGTPLELFGGRNGSMAAFIVVAYMNSIPMIYGGQEVGNAARLRFPFTSTKIDWDSDPGLKSEYKRIIAFRNKSTAIRRGSLQSFSSDDVCVFTKTLGSKNVLILSNLRDKQVVYEVPQSLTKMHWKDAFTGKRMTLNHSVSLRPYTYLVLEN